MIIFSTICYFFLTKNYIINQKITFFENSILILIATFGLMLFSMSYHLITLYLTIEVQSLCFYILTMSQRNSILSVEASLKYFILGSIASSFILLGSSFIYGLLGTLNFGQIYLILSNITFLDNIAFLNACSISFLFIFIGLFFKIGAAPFHLWLPDVYEGAPTNITLFFATVPKLAFLSILIRFIFDVLGDISIFFSNIFLIISILSILIGSFASVQQVKIKRLLAYSSISHIGFILLGF
jgi:NADH-quinone oxidoreductase subunit N